MEDVCSSSPARTPKLQENVGSHQKKKLHIQGQRRSTREKVGVVKSHLESNPIPARDAWRAQTKPCGHQETPHRLSQTCLWVFECLLWRCGSAGSGALSAAVHHGTFRRRSHYLHYLHHSLASGQMTGREHSPTHQQKIGLKIFWAWPCPSE